jgi:hypothetical protein
MAALSRACTVFYRSNSEIVSYNLTRDMAVISMFSCLWCTAYVEALRRADPPSRESYQMSSNKIQNPAKRKALERIGLSYPRTRILYFISDICELVIFWLKVKSPSLYTRSLDFDTIRIQYTYSRKISPLTGRNSVYVRHTGPLALFDSRIKLMTLLSATMFIFTDILSSWSKANPDH